MASVEPITLEKYLIDDTTGVKLHPVYFHEDSFSILLEAIYPHFIIRKRIALTAKYLSLAKKKRQNNQ